MWVIERVYREDCMMARAESKEDLGGNCLDKNKEVLVRIDPAIGVHSGVPVLLLDMLLSSKTLKDPPSPGRGPSD